MVAEAVRRDIEVKEIEAHDNYDSDNNLPSWALVDEDKQDRDYLNSQ